MSDFLFVALKSMRCQQNMRMISQIIIEEIVVFSKFSGMWLRRR